jgi:hypothetical protein
VTESEHAYAGDTNRSEYGRYDKRRKEVRMMKKESKTFEMILFSLCAAVFFLALPLAGAAEANMTFEEALANQDLSFEEILEYAENGDPQMQFLAAFGYDRGGDDFGMDSQRADYWYERSASRGNPMAKAMIAYRYHSGYGRRRDTSLARRLWEESLPGLLRERDRGNVFAILILGMFYEQRGRNYWYPRVHVIYRPLPPGHWYRDHLRRTPYPYRFRRPHPYMTPPHRWDDPRRHHKPRYEPPKAHPGKPYPKAPPPKPKHHPGKKKH